LLDLPESQLPRVAKLVHAQLDHVRAGFGRHRDVAAGLRLVPHEDGDAEVGHG
jgi:hypothetical protein